jgi:hypothetical protein
MRELVFFLEEPSAEVVLNALVPRLLPSGVSHRCIVFEGKQDLERRLIQRLRGYRNPDARFVIMRDQDAADCRKVKKQLQEKCREAGHPDALVRIVCHELESWYLADLAAVEQGLGIPRIQRRQNEAKYRSPDTLSSPKHELKRLTDDRYQEIGGSRAIAPYLDVDNLRSHSFAAFMSGVRRIAGLIS